MVYPRQPTLHFIFIFQVRNAAVEKVGLMCQFLTLYNLKHPQKQSVIVHAITFLVLAVEDIVITVAKKATCIVQSLKNTSLADIYTCLDDHFKDIPEDRYVLLHIIWVEVRGFFKQIWVFSVNPE